MQTLLSAFGTNLFGTFRRRGKLGITALNKKANKKLYLQLQDMKHFSYLITQQYHYDILNIIIT